MAWRVLYSVVITFYRGGLGLKGAINKNTQQTALYIYMVAEHW